MSIEYYVGTEGPTITVNSKDELWEALDIFQRQIAKNIGKDSPLIGILEKCKDEIDKSEG